jgi:hypothetical protein
MVSAKSLEIARRGEEIYSQRLRDQLEKTHWGFFVSIEPDSGDYYLGRRLEEAIGAARRAHPDKVTYTNRVGFPTAVEIGNCP